MEDPCLSSVLVIKTKEYSTPGRLGRVQDLGVGNVTVVVVVHN